MKQEPRSEIHMEKQLGLACKLGGAESLGISKAGQTVIARLVESQIWHQPARALERDNGLCSPQRQTLQPLPVFHWCPSSCHPGTGAQRE